LICEPQHCSGFLVAGRMVDLKAFGWGIVISTGLRKVQQEDDAPPPKKGDDYEMDCYVSKGSGSIVACKLSALLRISKIKATLPDDVDLKSEEGKMRLTELLEQIVEHPQFKDVGLPIMDPITEMKIEDTDLDDVMAREKNLEKKLEVSPIAQHPKLKELHAAFASKVKIQQRLVEINQTLHDEQFKIMADDLRAMRRMLRRLEFVDNVGVVTLKGRMACEILNGDEILLTEVIFNNCFEGLDGDMIIALLSCFCFDDRTEDEGSANLELQAAYDKCVEVARQVGATMQECKLPIEPEEYAMGLKPQMMDLVLKWLQGTKFSDLMENVDIMEGIVVRSMRRLEELTREVASAAKSIGNDALAEKLLESRKRFKRGIVFCASLYL